MAADHVGRCSVHLAIPGKGLRGAPFDGYDAMSADVAPPWPSSHTATPQRACPSGATEMNASSFLKWALK